MADNLKGIPFSSEDEGIDYILRAKLLVMDQHNILGVGTPRDRAIDPLAFDEIYVIWFTYVLGNWKVIISTSRPDGRIWEVTRNKEKHEIYVDSYLKTHNHVFQEAL